MFCLCTVFCTFKSLHVWSGIRRSRCLGEDAGRGGVDYFKNFPLRGYRFGGDMNDTVGRLASDDVWVLDWLRLVVHTSTAITTTTGLVSTSGRRKIC